MDVTVYRVFNRRGETLAIGDVAKSRTRSDGYVFDAKG